MDFISIIRKEKSLGNTLVHLTTVQAMVKVWAWVWAAMSTVVIQIILAL